MTAAENLMNQKFCCRPGVLVYTGKQQRKWRPGEDREGGNLKKYGVGIRPSEERVS